MTTETSAPVPPTPGRWDPLLRDLNALRVAAGEPSYAELSRRVTAHRIADGQDEHAARIAKSSVHDAFRMGRSRINLPLTRELVRALGGDPDVVDEWVARSGERLLAPTSGPQQPDGSAVPPAPPSAAQLVLLAAACVAFNLAGREFVDYFDLPIYLDMWGTAVAAIVLGPWRGAGVGLATNVIGAIGSGWVSIPFALVNVVGALVWGYGVRSWRMGATLPRFFTLNVLAALACSLVAVPLVVAFLGESSRVGYDAITVLLLDSFDTVVAATTFANLLTSLSDKLVSGFVALVVISLLPLVFRGRLPLVLVEGATGPSSPSPEDPRSAP